MKRLTEGLILLLVVVFAGCSAFNPKFIGNAHNWKWPGDKPVIAHYWGCIYESDRETFWGDYPWSQGIYKEIDGKLRTVGFKSCTEELSWGYGVQAVLKDRYENGPLMKSELGRMPAMHCRIHTLILNVGGDERLGMHEQRFDGGYGLVKGITYVTKDGASMSFINPGDNNTETIGEEALHGFWQGEFEQKNRAFVYPLNVVGLQPSLPVPPTIVHRRRNPDPAPDWNEDWHWNRDDEPGLCYEDLLKKHPELEK